MPHCIASTKSIHRSAWRRFVLRTGSLKFPAPPTPNSQPPRQRSSRHPFVFLTPINQPLPSATPRAPRRLAALTSRNVALRRATSRVVHAHLRDPTQRRATVVSQKMGPRLVDRPTALGDVMRKKKLEHPVYVSWRREWILANGQEGSEINRYLSDFRGQTTLFQERGKKSVRSILCVCELSKFDKPFPELFPSWIGEPAPPAPRRLIVAQNIIFRKTLCMDVRDAKYPFNLKLKFNYSIRAHIEMSLIWLSLLKCDPVINDRMRWIGSIGKFFSRYRGIFSHFPRGLQLMGLHRDTYAIASLNLVNWSIVTRPEFFRRLNRTCFNSQTNCDFSFPKLDSNSANAIKISTISPSTRKWLTNNCICIFRI